MDLKTFVAETLTQIVEGVAEAQKRIDGGGTGAAVNPDWVDSSSQATHGRAKPVEFDVAVMAGEESTENTGEKLAGSVGLISVLTARAAAEIDSRNVGAQRHETTSRIKFTVMLAQPGKITRQAPLSNPRGGWKVA
jgi:hypothetical protein